MLTSWMVETLADAVGIGSLAVEQLRGEIEGVGQAVGRVDAHDQR